MLPKEITSGILKLFHKFTVDFFKKMNVQKRKEKHTLWVSSYPQAKNAATKKVRVGNNTQCSSKITAIT